MKRFAFLLVLLVLLVVGGNLTNQLSAGGKLFTLPTIRATDNPDASALDMTPWKAEQLVLVIAFLLFSPFPPGLIPMTIGIIVVMWVLDWGVKKSKAEAQAEAKTKVQPASE